MVTHQLQVERRTGKFADGKTDIIPLFYATNYRDANCMGSRSPMERGNFDGEGAAHCNVYRDCVPLVSCAKTSEPIEMPFGLWTQVGRRKHVLHGGRLAPPGEYD